MHWRWLAVGFGVLSLGLIVGGVALVRLPPRTYREAVMQVLDDQRVAYDEVMVDTACPPSPHCFGTDTVVIPLTGYVTVSGARPLHGRVTCALRASTGETYCTLSITELDIRSLPLPALVDDPPWLALLRQAWHNRLAWRKW